MHSHVLCRIRLERLLPVLAFASLQCITTCSNGDEGISGGKARIAGGQIPPEGKYPSLVRIINPEDKFQDGFQRPLCGGTILNRNWVLTSGVCLARKGNSIVNISKLRVVAGDSIVNKTEPYEQILGIERVIIHRRLDEDQFLLRKMVNDNIAVLKVVPPIKFSNRVSPVNLPTCDEDELGTAWIPGWGMDRTGNNMGIRPNAEMHEVQVPIVTTGECNKWLKDTDFGEYVNDLQMCTRQVNGMSWCWFDHGGPLFLIKNASYMVQIGIASLRPFAAGGAFSCGQDGFMTVSTRVSKYLGWIHRRISGCGNHPFRKVTGVQP